MEPNPLVTTPALAFEFGRFVRTCHRSGLFDGALASKIRDAVSDHIIKMKEEGFITEFHGQQCWDEYIRGMKATD